MDTRKAEILKELDEKFSKIQKELGFKVSLDELDEIFFIRDEILRDRFVSDQLSRQIAHRITNTYQNWTGYLHSIIMPNPHNLMNANEAKMFSEDERKELLQFMSKIMALISVNTLVGMNNDRVMEAKFFDDSVKFWKDEFQPVMIKYMEKVKSEWHKKVK